MGMRAKLRAQRRVTVVRNPAKIAALFEAQKEKIIAKVTPTVEIPKKRGPKERQPVKTPVEKRVARHKAPPEVRKQTSSPPPLEPIADLTIDFNAEAPFPAEGEEYFQKLPNCRVGDPPLLPRNMHTFVDKWLMGKLLGFLYEQEIIFVGIESQAGNVWNIFGRRKEQGLLLKKIQAFVRKHEGMLLKHVITIHDPVLVS